MRKFISWQRVDFFMKIKDFLSPRKLRIQNQGDFA
jgi:hypothetical protein